MRKKTCYLLMTLLITLQSYADVTGTCGENVTWTLFEKTGVLLLKGTGPMENYQCSPFVNNYNIKQVIVEEGITSIGQCVFDGCHGLTSIAIPQSVTSIGESAFSGCSSLTSITIPQSVTSIGKDAFSRCSSLTSITIPQSVTSIGESAFSRCSSLTSITIPQSVTSIGEWAFWGCTGLTSIAIPNSVTRIGDAAFWGCTGLTSITIPQSVTSIGDAAFWGCTGLTSIDIPSSVTRITGFSGCTGLTSITIPNSVTFIGDEAFSGCSGLTSITIPNSVTFIGDEAFCGCSGLTSITIPNSVTVIGDYAFCGTGLTSITIPNSVENICDRAFYGCYFSKNAVIYDSKVIYDSNEDFYGAIIYDDKTIDGLLIVKDKVVKCIPTGTTSVTIPNSVTSIGKWAFCDRSSLTSITIPNSVTRIGDGAFWGCTGLTSIYIPSSVTSISKIAFYECNDLSILLESFIPPHLYNDDYIYDDYNLENIVYVPKNALEIYENSTGWEHCDIRVPFIELSRASLNIEKNNTDTLTAKFIPVSSNQELQWTSSNEDIVTVNNGFVTAINYGTATITVSSVVDNEICSMCEVIVMNAGVTELQALVNSTQAIIDEAVEGNAIGNYNPGAKAELQNVIDEISSIISVSMTDEQINEAANRINAALAIFESEKVLFVDDIKYYDNVLFAEDSEGSAGSQIELPIMLKNVDEISNIQFDLVLPAGVTIALDQDGYELIDICTDRTSSKRHVVDYLEQADGSIRIMCTSSKNYTFSGNEGCILKVTLNISDKMEEGEFPIILKNIVSSNYETTYNVLKITSTLTIINYVLGDINSDGAINVGDLSRLVNMILTNYTEDDNKFKAADINGDKLLNVGDYSRLVQMILNASASCKSFSVGIESKSYSNTFAQLGTNDINIASGYEKQIALSLNNDGIDYSALQFDLALPEGLELVENGVSTTARTAGFNIDTNGSRVILHNMHNASISGSEGEMLNLTIKADNNIENGDYEIGFENITLVTPESNVVFGKSFKTTVHVDNPTNVDGIYTRNGLTMFAGNGQITLSADKSQTVIVYSIDGAIVAEKAITAGETYTLNLASGIYIINNVKINIK